jgi:seryl-tRNA synthetase
MQMPDPRKNSQTTGMNSFGLAGNILLASILFGYQSPWWLFLSIPMVLMSFTAESKLRK